MSTFRNTEPLSALTLPCLPMRGIVAFPGITMSIELSRDICRKAYEVASASDGFVFLTSQKSAEFKPEASDLNPVGCVAKVRQSTKASDGTVRVMLEGKYRAHCSGFVIGHSFVRAVLDFREASKTEVSENDNAAILRTLVMSANEVMKYSPTSSRDIATVIRVATDFIPLTDFLAANLLVKFEDKQSVLSEFDPYKRAALLLVLLANESEILQAEQRIRARVQESMDKNQRDYYLREQLKAIEDELDEEDEEIAEYQAALDKLNVPKDVAEKLSKDLKKLSKSPYASAESSVLRNYLDTIIDIPWGKRTKDRIDIERARKILDRDHYGLTKVKERILEFLAVKQLNPDCKSPIICLVGPPGVGKTSIASSVAEAMGRKFVRASLGGVRDEADIRGHRKTYVGAMPGRIIDALVRAKVENPLLLLDEIDKVGNDTRNGDPSAALLEVLDSEQNHAFRDHFVEVPVDLSGVLFICTANTLSTVPRPLIDRMDVIELDSYTRLEKLQIAKRHLLPKQRKLHGLKASQFSISDDALLDIIDLYTREAGVRNLERLIGSVMRKGAMELAEGGAAKVSVKRANLSSFIEEHKMLPTVIDEEDEVGCVNGLAYTEVGGDLLKIEAAVLEGDGKLELTGSLGDVMKESAQAAVSYIRSVAERLGIDPSFHKAKDIHIHVPEGAVPKDGPSAGVAIMTALTSALSGVPVYRDLAMTGEITLRGKVLPIGGLKEKLTAAYAAGVRRVVIPFDNQDDLRDVDDEVRNALSFIPCRTADEVLKAALHMPENVPTQYAVYPNLSQTQARIGL